MYTCGLTKCAVFAHKDKNSCTQQISEILLVFYEIQLYKYQHTTIIESRFGQKVSWGKISVCPDILARTLAHNIVHLDGFGYVMSTYVSNWCGLNWYGHVCRYVPRPDQWHKRGLRWCGAACSNFSVSPSLEDEFSCNHKFELWIV